MGFDKKISYWIFVWFLIYYLNYTSYNPFLLLVLGFIFNVFNIFYMLFKKMNGKAIIFSFIVTLTKLIPILLLIYDNRSYIDVKSLNFTVIFVVIYLLYMRLTNTSLIKAYSIKEKNNTPLANIIEKYISNK